MKWRWVSLPAVPSYQPPGIWFGLVWLFNVLGFFFGGGVSLCSPGWPRALLLLYPLACWDCRPVPSIASVSINSRVFVSFPEWMYHDLQWPLCIVVTMIFSNRMEELETRQNAPERNQTLVCYSVVESIFSFFFPHKTGSHIAQTVLKFTMQLRLAMNSGSSCFCLKHAWRYILPACMSVCHMHSWCPQKPE